jgi:hypothetical protein
MVHVRTYIASTTKTCAVNDIKPSQQIEPKVLKKKKSNRANSIQRVRLAWEAQMDCHDSVTSVFSRMIATTQRLGLKIKRKRTETCFTVFVSLYLVGIENGIENPGNEYENENHRI